MTELMAANKAHLGTLVFGSGVEIVVPRVQAKAAVGLPPWEAIP